MNKVFLQFLMTTLFIVGATSSTMATDMKDMPISTEHMAAMESMLEYSTPNENHKFLSTLAGSWKAKVTFWMDPKSPAQESEGTAQSKMTMDGRFLEQHYHGSMMSQPFEGRAIWGYDNLRKEFTGIWFDSMATGVMISSAKYDAKAKTLTEVGSMSCPITKEKHRWYKAVTTIIDADHYTYESYMKDKEGNEYKGMFITYSRVM
ncbi:MAG: DUF1579 domain-containing protein [Candidatus Omnitrophica bacterium]|nr:DUF1579 domain-containing protein [Candidatus Omnitrophota bacterium]